MKVERHEPLAFAGPSLIELAQEKLDEVTAAIMEGHDTEKEKGRAIGMSQIIAIFLNPYAPKPKTVREEAKRRWREGQAGK